MHHVACPLGSLHFHDDRLEIVHPLNEVSIPKAAFDGWEEDYRETEVVSRAEGFDLSFREVPPLCLDHRFTSYGLLRVDDGEQQLTVQMDGYGMQAFGQWLAN